MTFKSELRDWRIGHKLSQKLAAEILGMEYKTYQNWEYGRTEPKSKPCRRCVESKMNLYKK